IIIDRIEEEPMIGLIRKIEILQEIKEWLAAAGFERIDVQIKRKSSEFIQSDLSTGKLDDYVASADVTAWKP
ncbi:MAG TPA: hypothetical protein VE242_10475, partial [Chthoniobacterales bacterium]|nr:hypothetical protein [Chthoniobacterales bacterium]